MLSAFHILYIVSLQNSILSAFKILQCQHSIFYIASLHLPYCQPFTFYIFSILPQSILSALHILYFQPSKFYIVSLPHSILFVSLPHSIISAFHILYCQSSTIYIFSLPHSILSVFHIPHSLFHIFHHCSLFQFTYWTPHIFSYCNSNPCNFCAAKIIADCCLFSLELRYWNEIGITITPINRMEVNVPAGAKRLSMVYGNWWKFPSVSWAHNA